MFFFVVDETNCRSYLPIISQASLRQRRMMVDGRQVALRDAAATRIAAVQRGRTARRISKLRRLGKRVASHYQKEQSDGHENPLPMFMHSAVMRLDGRLLKQHGLSWQSRAVHVDNLQFKYTSRHGDSKSIDLVEVAKLVIVSEVCACAHPTSVQAPIQVSSRPFFFAGPLRVLHLQALGWRTHLPRRNARAIHLLDGGPAAVCRDGTLRLGTLHQCTRALACEASLSRHNIVQLAGWWRGRCAAATITLSLSALHTLACSISSLLLSRLCVQAQAYYTL